MAGPASSGQDFDRRQDDRQPGIEGKSATLEPRDIHHLLERYKAAASLIRANLGELDAQPTYVQLTTGTLGSETGARLGEAMRRAPELWNWLMLLQAVLDEASELMAQGRLNGERRDRVQFLLYGPSILVGVGSTPFGHRDLVGRPHHELRVTVAALIDQMRETYEPIRNGVAEVERIWRELLPRIESGAATILRLQNQLTELGAREPLVDEVAERLDELRSTIALDPLAVSVEDGVLFDATLERSVAKVTELRRGHDRLDEDLAGVETKLAELRVMRARAAAALSETEVKIRNPGSLIQVPTTDPIDGSGGLAERADRLRSHGWGPWTERRQRIDDWLAIAERYHQQFDRADRINRTPLARRAELRGLLDAYKAKAAVVGRIEDEHFIRLADEAHNELHTAPTDLARAATLVADLGASLRNSVSTPTKPGVSS